MVLLRKVHFLPAQFSPKIPFFDPSGHVCLGFAASEIHYWDLFWPFLVAKLIRAREQARASQFCSNFAILVHIWPKKRDKKCAIFLFWVHFFAVFLFIWVYFYQYFFKFICLKNKNDFLWQLKKKLIFFKFSYSFLWNGCGIFIIQFRIANYPKMFLFYPKILKTSEKNHFQKNRNCAPVEALCGALPVFTTGKWGPFHRL